MSRIDLAKLDFFSAEVQECPFRVYQQLQDEAPVWQMPGTNVFVVTRYNDIREVIRDPGRFSNNFSALLNAGSSNEEVSAIYEQGYERGSINVSSNSLTFKFFILLFYFFSIFFCESI